jgi:hypothetical protein
MVLEQGRYVGLVGREELRSAMLIGNTGTLAALARKVAPVHSTDPALPVYQRMMAEGMPAVPVLVAGSATAVLTRDRLMDAFNAQLAGKR